MPGSPTRSTELGTRHDLLLLTKGQPEEQQRKIDASGLAHHFGSVHIVAEKRAPTYRELIASTTWPRTDLDDRQLAGLGHPAGRARSGWARCSSRTPTPGRWSTTRSTRPTRGILHLQRFPELLEHF